MAVGRGSRASAPCTRPPARAQEPCVDVPRVARARRRRRRRRACPSRRRHDDRVRAAPSRCWSKPQRDARGAAADRDPARRGRRAEQRRVRERRAREHERPRAAIASSPSHGCAARATSREVAEDRRDVAVGRRGGRRSRRTSARSRAPHGRARPQRPAPSGKIAATSARPPERVVEERRAREEPGVLLVDQERGRPKTSSASEQRRASTSGSCSLPRTSASSDRAGEHRRPAAQAPWASMWSVEFVKKTITGQSRTPERRRRATARGRRASGAGARPRVPDDRLARAGSSPSSRKPAANSQWTMLGAGLHQSSLGRSRSSISPGATSEREDEPDARSRAAAAGRGAHQKPWPCGCRSVDAGTAGRSPRRRRRASSAGRAPRSRVRGPNGALRGAANGQAHRRTRYCSRHPLPVLARRVCLGAAGTRNVPAAPGGGSAQPTFSVPFMPAASWPGTEQKNV